MKKKLLTTTIITAIVLVTLSVFLSYHYSAYTYYTGDIALASYEFVADDKAVVTHFENKNKVDEFFFKLFGNREAVEKYDKGTLEVFGNEEYFVALQANFKGSPSFSFTQFDFEKSFGESWKIFVYKKVGSELKKTREVDLAKIQLDENIDVSLSFSELQTLPNGHTGILVSGDTDDRFLDLEDGKVLPREETKDLNYPGWENRFTFRALINPDKDEKKLRLPGLSERFPESYMTTFNPYKLREAGSSLPISSDYPKAYELLLQENSYLTMMVDPSKSKENVRADASVLGLFYKGGFDAVFEDYPISAERSVDGKAHTVNSYEEFMRYYNFDTLGRGKA